MSYVSNFPFSEIRPLQKVILEEIHKAFHVLGKKVVLLESPVGSGKSPMAIAMAKSYFQSHIITPRKGLQDQYYDDFHREIVLMKGRRSYPCTIHADHSAHITILSQIQRGSCAAPRPGEDNCGQAPCIASSRVKKYCETTVGPCPYKTAMEVAQGSDIIVHNLHSFVFQTEFGQSFEPREFLAIDEAHDVEGMMRDFITKELSVGRGIEAREIAQIQTPADWVEFFRQDINIPKETASERAKKDMDPSFVSVRDSYLATVDLLEETYVTSSRPGKMTVKVGEVESGSRGTQTTFKFIPHEIGSAAQRFLFNYGEKVVLMSGTIYDKELYCKNNGLNPEEVYFIRVPSTFPVENRPVYCRQDLQVDTSYANWEAGFGTMIDTIRRIMSVYKDVKGLIHAPSYSAARQIEDALRSDRIVTHEAHDFARKLQAFYTSKAPEVFVSPTCQQGVDFKADRARFQIVVRIPYPGQDLYIKERMQYDFPWYNLQALTAWGQMLGRVNRSPDDYGATFLLDSRFNRFINRNRRLIPKWQLDSIIYK